MEILFVHLGKSVPSHLVENFTSFKLRFPNLDVKIILSDDCKIPKQLNTNDVCLDNSDQRDHLFAHLDHDPKFRNQFWRKSLERILAVCEYQIKNSESSVVHFESDILVLPNFPFDEFEEIDSISWQNYNQDRDVASIIYIPNRYSSKWLHDKLLEQISNNTAVTDMSALREIRRNYPSMCHVIPNIISKTDLAQNRSHGPEKSASVFRKMTDGIFDSAQIGMWLVGMDPRNTYGVLRIHDRSILDSGEAPLDPSRLNYSLDQNGCLHAILEDKIVLPIFSLHIHSKRLQLFKSTYSRDLINFVNLANNQKDAVNRFEPTVLIKLFSNSILSGNTLNFFLGIPLLYRLRIKIRNLTTRK